MRDSIDPLFAVLLSTEYEVVIAESCDLLSCPSLPSLSVWGWQFVHLCVSFVTFSPAVLFLSLLCTPKYSHHDHDIFNLLTVHLKRKQAFCLFIIIIYLRRSFQVLRMNEEEDRSTKNHLRATGLQGLPLNPSEIM